jgi:hypothetical protein
VLVRPALLLLTHPAQALLLLLVLVQGSRLRA